MSEGLEDFVRGHREAFDSEEPGEKVWDRVRRQMDPPKKQRTIVLHLTRASLGAAAILLVLAAGAWWFNAGHTETASANDPALRVLPPAHDPSSAIQPPADSQATAAPDGDPSPADVTTLHKEMYLYVQLVELNQKKLQRIEKDRPLLYRRFSADLHKLDSVYHGLQEQLEGNPNREQLLKAMLQDLQLQMKLLNRQLDVIKQIDHTKKYMYDSSYKSL